MPRHMMRTRDATRLKRGIAHERVKSAGVHMLALGRKMRRSYPFFLTSLTLVNSMPSARSLV